MRESIPNTSSIINSKSWQKFSLAPRITKRYYWIETHLKSEPEKIGASRYIIVSGVPGRVVGLKSPNR